MILSQPELRAAVAAGEIKFDPPLEERQWAAASIDLRLGTQFTKLQMVPAERACGAMTAGTPESHYVTVNDTLREKN